MSIAEALCETCLQRVHLDGCHGNKVSKITIATVTEILIDSMLRQHANETN